MGIVEKEFFGDAERDLALQKLTRGGQNSEFSIVLFEIIGKPRKDQIAERCVLMSRIVVLIFFFRAAVIVLMSRMSLWLFLCKRVSMNDPGSIVQNMGVEKKGIRYNDQPMGKKKGDAHGLFAFGEAPVCIPFLHRLQK